MQQLHLRLVTPPCRCPWARTAVCHDAGMAHVHAQLGDTRTRTRGRGAQRVVWHGQRTSKFATIPEFHTAATEVGSSTGTCAAEHRAPVGTCVCIYVYNESHLRSPWAHDERRCSMMLDGTRRVRLCARARVCVRFCACVCVCGCVCSMSLCMYVRMHVCAHVCMYIYVLKYSYHLEASECACVRVCT